MSAIAGAAEKATAARAKNITQTPVREFFAHMTVVLTKKMVETKHNCEHDSRYFASSMFSRFRPEADRTLGAAPQAGLPQIANQDLMSQVYLRFRQA